MRPDNIRQAQQVIWRSRESTKGGENVVHRERTVSKTTNGLIDGFTGDSTLFNVCPRRELSQEIRYWQIVEYGGSSPPSYEKPLWLAGTDHDVANADEETGVVEVASWSCHGSLDTN